ncbi:MAG: murein tripeptide amidase MpaA [Fibrobacter sp.]|nr:murein tripeptide amidase MpaA [Fibrobacter sp.]
MVFKTEARGKLQLPLKEYGRSVLGCPLLYIPCKGACRLLVVAGIHGEESETTFLLSRCLRAFETIFDHTAFVLCANPDGMTLGTRGNANGVDLNRNFSTTNWKPQTVLSRSVIESNRDTALFSGECAESEPETQCLVRLMENLSPQTILSIHAPLACIDAPEKTRLVHTLCSAFHLPWIPDIGYPTPGSLGTWCKERSKKQNPIDCITLELPRMSLEALFDRYASSFTNWLVQPLE